MLKAILLSMMVFIGLMCFGQSDDISMGKPPAPANNNKPVEVPSKIGNPSDANEEKEKAKSLGYKSVKDYNAAQNAKTTVDGKSANANNAEGKSLVKVSFGSLEKRANEILEKTFPNDNKNTSNYSVEDFENEAEDLEQKMDAELLEELHTYYGYKSMAEKNGDESAEKAMRRGIRVKKTPTLLGGASNKTKQGESIGDPVEDNGQIDAEDTEEYWTADKIAEANAAAEAKRNADLENQHKNSVAYMYKGIKDYNKALYEYKKDHGYIK